MRVPQLRLRPICTSSTRPSYLHLQLFSLTRPLRSTIRHLDIELENSTKVRVKGGGARARLCAPTFCMPSPRPSAGRACWASCGIPYCNKMGLGGIVSYCISSFNLAHSGKSQFNKIQAVPTTHTHVRRLHASTRTLHTSAVGGEVGGGGVF